MVNDSCGWMGKSGDNTSYFGRSLRKLIAVEEAPEEESPWIYITLGNIENPFVS